MCCSSSSSTSSVCVCVGGGGGGACVPLLTDESGVATTAPTREGRRLPLSTPTYRAHPDYTVAAESRFSSCVWIAFQFTPSCVCVCVCVAVSVLFECRERGRTGPRGGGGGGLSLVSFGLVHSLHGAARDRSSINID